MVQGGCSREWARRYGTAEFGGDASYVLGHLYAVIAVMDGIGTLVAGRSFH